MEQRVNDMKKEAYERIQAEKALKKSEEKYRTILESIEDGYYEMDVSGNLTFFNDSLCRIIGYSRDELIGMNNRQYMDKETAEKVGHARSGKDFKTECRLNGLAEKGQRCRTVPSGSPFSPCPTGHLH
jgi:PAS domain-containing protein